MDSIINQIADFFLQLGYFGIFAMMFLEASFFPFPSEVAVIPAGFLVAEGSMEPIIVLLSGTLGSVLGASLNYIIGKYFGEKFLYKYGKYMFLDDKKLSEMEILFKTKGRSIVFFGRLVPVVRQYISFPPGISRMPYLEFAIFTALGSGIWVAFLEFIGYYYGNNQNAINSLILKFKFIVIGLLILFTISFILKKLKILKK